MKVVTLLFLLKNVMSIYSWLLDNVCDVDDIKCQNPQISNPGEIIYGQCYRHAALRRLLKVSFLTCLKECMKTSTCSSVSYRRSWKMCDINGNMNSEVEAVQENGCFSSNISSWSKKLVGKCARHTCEEGYKCVLEEEGMTCVIAYCTGRPFAANAELNEPFGLSRDLGHGMMYKCPNKMHMYGKPFAVCRKTGIWKSLFICGEGSLVSQSKETGQSTIHQCSTQYVCNAGAGVDGIKDRTNMFHTQGELKPFWWVNLGQVYKVFKVISTNRIGAYAERLRQMLVHVGDSLEISPMELCGEFNGPATSGQVIVTQCKTLPEGQIVKLTSVNNEKVEFHLAEVEVYGV